MSFIQVTMSGYLGQDPELRQTSNGSSVCSFSMAHNPPAQGDKQPATIWLKCEVWGRQGEICGQYLRKGSMPTVSGSLVKESWIDKQTGDPRQGWVIKNAVLLQLGPVKDPDSQPANNPRQSTPQAPAPQSAPQPVAAGNHDDYNDIPF